MDFFTSMVWIAVLMGAYFAYLVFFKGKSGKEAISVMYSERIGNDIVESTKIYTGVINEHDDTMDIVKLGIKRPVPSRDYMKSTFDGKKIVHLIKFGPDRYGYRIPSLKNEVYTYKRDDYGNIILEDGKKKLVKHQWTLCDDVVEPDVKHWEDGMQELIKKKHQSKKDFWDRWGGAVSIVLIFMFATIIFNQGSKVASEHYDRIMKEADQQQKDAATTQRNLNTLIEKITGTKVLDDNEAAKRDEFNEESKS